MKAAIAPFVTTTWGQYAPYNQHCPDVFGELAPTGCVATAMAQIMYHYQFPQQTRKAIHGYPSNDPTYDIYLAIADIPVTTIEWEDMARFFNVKSIAMLPLKKDLLQYSTLY